ncbi:MAG: diacylglycerol kinase family lipid kinase, partial [Calditrichaeota bacterium]|nr:diacylglycerol kinase family lipid kinase [Calditrichota bacterium]
GRGRSLKVLEDVKPLFEEAGIELTISRTDHVGHARQLARDFDISGYNGICAIGGDGTMHEVVNGLLSREDGLKIPIGLIPGGTGCSFMYDLGCLDPLEAAKRIISGKRRPIDAAMVEAGGESLYAFNMIGWGMVDDINRLAEKIRWLGGQRYTVAALLLIIVHRKRRAKLIINGVERTDNFIFGIGCNTMHTGRAMKMAPKAVLDDGLIDLVIVRKAGRLELLKVFPKIFNGTHIASPFVEYHQVKEFSIIPDEVDTLTIDGEPKGCTPVHVKMMEEGFEVFE